MQLQGKTGHFRAHLSTKKLLLVRTAQRRPVVTKAWSVLRKLIYQIYLSIFASSRAHMNGEAKIPSTLMRLTNFQQGDVRRPHLERPVLLPGWTYLRQRGIAFLFQLPA